MDSQDNLFQQLLGQQAFSGLGNSLANQSTLFARPASYKHKEIGHYWMSALTWHGRVAGHDVTRCLICKKTRCRQCLKLQWRKRTHR